MSNTPTNTMDYKKEIMSAEFTKHLFDFKGKYDPFHMAVHHFSGPDKGGPHDHPFRFRTHILKGIYLERVYTISSDGTWNCRDVLRVAGTSHEVEADTIHEIVDLPQGECWTVIQPMKKVQEPGFYRFNAEGAWHRYWYEREFTRLEKNLQLPLNQ